MQNVVLLIHLILALALIGVVLLQRSEGGIGLGSGSAGVISGRGAATALGRVTWILAIAFICTSLVLTIIAASNSSGVSVLDRLRDSTPAPASEQGELPLLPGEDDGLLPPPTGGSQTPLIPRAE